MERIKYVGFEVEPERRDRLTEELMDMHACKPVFISNEIADLHYNGFSNGYSNGLFL